jgi:hypothetical protein
MNELDQQYENLADAYIRLTREARALSKTAAFLDDGEATVSVAALNRLTRELKGEPQPSMPGCLQVERCAKEPLRRLDSGLRG